MVEEELLWVYVALGVSLLLLVLWAGIYFVVFSSLPPLLERTIDAITRYQEYQWEMKGE